jgi:polyketide biosynthesis acyl carrier protein
MNKEEIFKIITRHTVEVLPGLEAHQFSGVDSFLELGANSIDRAEIWMLTLESLNLDIPLIETARTKTIRELVDFLHSKL